MQSKHGFNTTPARSSLMKKIKSTNTKPEVLLRKKLWTVGYRYRINVKELPGKPDIVFFRKKIAIFVDGEFWHGYNWIEKKHKIKANRDYWIHKIEGNIERDYKTNQRLKNMGWKVFRFWEHDVTKNTNVVLNKIITCLT